MHRRVVKLQRSATRIQSRRLGSIMSHVKHSIQSSHVDLDTGTGVFDVWCPKPEHKKLSIAVPVPNRNPVVYKWLDRSASETLRASLARLSKALGMTAELVDEKGERFDESSLNISAWPIASELVLCPNVTNSSMSTTQPYRFIPRVNAPVLKSLHCLHLPLVGLPLIAHAAAADDVAYDTSNGDFFFRWCVQQFSPFHCASMKFLFLKRNWNEDCLLLQQHDH